MSKPRTNRSRRSRVKSFTLSPEAIEAIERAVRASDARSASAWLDEALRRDVFGFTPRYVGVDGVLAKQPDFAHAPAVSPERPPVDQAPDGPAGFSEFPEPLVEYDDPRVAAKKARRG